VARLDGFTFQRSLDHDHFLATEQQSGRTVVVQAVRKSHEEDEHRKIISDAWTASRIAHPNIQKVLDIKFRDGMIYLIKEYYSTRTLCDLIVPGQEALSVSEKRGVLVQVAEGLRKAHANKLVHGNLTPECILIDSRLVPKLVFPSLLQVGSPTYLLQVGSPTYLAPEAIRGSSVDGRADIWSFGVIMFELLTGGSRPFAHRGSNRIDLLHEISSTSASPMPLRQIDSRLSKGLECIVSKCLSLEVAGRYSSASDLAEDLRRCRLSDPRPWGWFRRNRD
jgi:serine/threonine-protein kinase